MRHCKCCLMNPTLPQSNHRHMATSILYPNGGPRLGRSPRKGLGLGRPGPPTPHFYRQGPGQPGPPQSLTFIDRPWAGPAPNPSLLLANPSLLSTGPGPAQSPTPHFYWPDPSLLSARPLTSIGQARPRHAGPCRPLWPRSQSPHVSLHMPGADHGMDRPSL